ncbi:MAG: hypothetical protein HY769_04970 [Candidatus Stahlbacteria bacterium]|nr:hypothetical protein [Candidatus Stahlbacteria bacterium]
MQFVRYKKLADEEVPTGKAYLGTFVETFPNSIGFVHVYKATQIAELYGKVQEGRYGFYIREIKKMYPRMGFLSGCYDSAILSSRWEWGPRTDPSIPIRYFLGVGFIVGGGIMRRIAFTRKVCPSCAERVNKAAKVCKHCGYKFEELEKAEQEKKEEKEV